MKRKPTVREVKALIPEMAPDLIAIRRRSNPDMLDVLTSLLNARLGLDQYVDEDGEIVHEVQLTRRQIASLLAKNPSVVEALAARCRRLGGDAMYYPSELRTSQRKRYGGGVHAAKLVIRAT